MSLLHFRQSCAQFLADISQYHLFFHHVTAISHTSPPNHTLTDPMPPTPCIYPLLMESAKTVSLFHFWQSNCFLPFLSLYHVIFHRKTMSGLILTLVTTIQLIWHHQPYTSTFCDRIWKKQWACFIFHKVVKFFNLISHNIMNFSL